MRGLLFFNRKRQVIYGVLVLLVSIITAGCVSHKTYDNPVVIIKTKFGDLLLELYQEKAPATVAAFLANADSGFYKNTSFYRILRSDNQVTGAIHAHFIQGGIWQSNPDDKSKFKFIPHESTRQTGILHSRGVISMARNEPGTATSEFFICITDEPEFNEGGAYSEDKLGYAAFGKVVEGMDVLDKIYQQPEYKQRFMPPVTILDIQRLQL